MIKVQPAGTNGSPPMTPKNEETFKKLVLKTISWFQYWKVSFFFGAGLFCIPYKFKYNTLTSKFHVHSSAFQKFMWISLQLTGILVMRVRINEGIDYVQNSTEKLRYFDFGFLIVVYCFDAIFKTILWGKRKKLEAFLDELQTSLLLPLASKSSNRNFVLLAAFCISYLIPSFFYFCLTWGIDSWDLNLFFEAVQKQAVLTFNLDESWTVSPYFPVLCLCSFIVNQYQASFWHFNDIYILSSIFLMHNVASDFRQALNSHHISESHFLRMVEAYRELIRKFNDALGLGVCVYSLYCTPYYAAHLLDMLDLPDFLNRFSMTVYLGFLAVGLAAAVDMNTIAAEMKKWIHKKQFHLVMKPQALAIFLDDLRFNKFGLGTFFTVGHNLAGQIVNLILTLAVITIQMRMLPT